MKRRLAILAATTVAAVALGTMSGGVAEAKPLLCVAPPEVPTIGDLDLTQLPGACIEGIRR